MKAHIEYDDFGEYIETLEDLDHFEVCTEKPKQAEVISIKQVFRKAMLIVTAMMIMFCTSSYASGCGSRTNDGKCCLTGGRVFITGRSGT